MTIPSGNGALNAGDALQERLKRILNLDKVEYVNSFIERNETAVLATLRLFDKERRDALVGVNREVVERVYSHETIARQLYKVVTAL